MKQGTVIWFGVARGYGFIKPDDGGADVFVHYSGIDADGFRNLQPAQRVEFDLAEEERGFMAVNVRVVS